jgi:ribosomal protein S18 acetylase RimI-like enzyme
MNLFSAQINDLQLSPDIQIIELKEQRHFTIFSELVNSEIMASEMLFNLKLLNVLKSGGEIKIFGLFKGKQLASTLLVFTEFSNAGLYFIATKKEFQKKGYASILIRFVVNNLFEGGIKEVVLHANNFATGIYKKLGFTHQNNFVIYKIL